MSPGPEVWKFPFRLASAVNLSCDLEDVFKLFGASVLLSVKGSVGQICGIITPENFFCRFGLRTLCDDIFSNLMAFME